MTKAMPNTVSNTVWWADEKSSKIMTQPRNHCSEMFCPLRNSRDVITITAADTALSLSSKKRLGILRTLNPACQPSGLFEGNHCELQSYIRSY
jgi:hypothetical protein